MALPQRYSYKPRCGNILKVYPQINGERKCDPYTQWKTDSDRKEMLPWGTTWMNLEDNMLNGINQFHKDDCCMTALK